MPSRSQEHNPSDKRILYGSLGSIALGLGLYGYMVSSEPQSPRTNEIDPAIPPTHQPSPYVPERVTPTVFILAPTLTPAATIWPPTVEAAAVKEQSAFALLRQVYTDVQQARNDRIKNEQLSQVFPPFQERVDMELNKDRINGYFRIIDNHNNSDGIVVFSTYTQPVIKEGVTYMDIATLSPPRDLNVPEYSVLKGQKNKFYRINTNMPEEYVRLMLENATGLSMDVSLTGHLNFIKESVRLMGGVTIEVNQTFITRYGAEFATKGKPLQLGTNRMTPEQAEWYARVRKMDSDYFRRSRIENLLAAAINEIHNNPSKALDLLPLIVDSNVKGQAQTQGIAEIGGNISLQDLSSYLNAYTNAQGVKSKVRTRSIDPHWPSFVESNRIPADKGQSFIKSYRGPRHDNPKAALVPQGSEQDLYWVHLRDHIAQNIIPGH